MSGAKQNAPDSKLSLGRLLNSPPPKSAQEQGTILAEIGKWPVRAMPLLAWLSAIYSKL